jgi:hypothetical protein
MGEETRTWNKDQHDTLAFNPIFRPDGNAFEPGVVLSFFVLQTATFQDLKKRKLILDRDAAKQAPADIGHVKINGGIFGILRQQTAFFDKASDRFHGNAPLIIHF